jgi:hypothetical protein
VPIGPKGLVAMNDLQFVTGYVSGIKTMIEEGYMKETRNDPAALKENEQKDMIFPKIFWFMTTIWCSICPNHINRKRA